MIMLPSVGSKVVRVQLNKTATRAKITFNDQTSIIVSTNSSESTVQKPVQKKTINESKKQTSGYKIVKNKHGEFAVPTKQLVESTISKMTSGSNENLSDVIERAKHRADIIAEKNMTSSEKFGLENAGKEINLPH